MRLNCAIGGDSAQAHIDRIVVCDLRRCDSFIMGNLGS